MLQLLLRAQVAHPKLFLAAALALVVACFAYTFLNLQFLTSHKNLIHHDNRLIQLLEKAERFSELDSFVVIVENRNTSRTIGFADELYRRLRSDKAHYDQVFAGVNPADFRRWALLYLSKSHLSSLDAKIRENSAFIRSLARSASIVSLYEEVNSRIASYMLGELFTGFLDEPAPKTAPEDIEFLVDLLDATKQHLKGSSEFVSPWHALFGDKGSGYEAEDAYNWTDDRKYLVISVAPKLRGDGVGKARDSLHALRQTIREVKADFTDISVGVTGQKALDEDETEAAFRDITRGTVLSLLGLAGLLTLFWRGLRKPLIELCELIVALSLTFGLTTLVIGHLNLLSVAFAPMILGLGIDYGIHWCSRYIDEERQRGATKKEALARTMASLGPTVLLAGICAALSFLPLVLTGFKGLVELGLICAIGMGATTLTTLGLLPALILILDRPHIDNGIVLLKNHEPRRLRRLTGPTSMALACFAILALGASLFAASKVRFDLNTLNLQSKASESVIWEKRLIDNSKLASIHGVAFAHSISEVKHKTLAMKQLPSVADVQSILDLLPSDQDNKLALLKQLKPLVDDLPPFVASDKPVDVDRFYQILGSIRFKMLDSEAARSGADRETAGRMRKVRELIDDVRNHLRQDPAVETQKSLKGFERMLFTDLNEKLALIKTGVDARPMTMKDIPKPLLDRFMGPDSLFLIRVLPSQYIWDPDNLATFVNDIKSVDPDVTGDPVTLSIFTRAFRDACIQAALYAIIFIFVFLTLTLRSLTLTLAALVPLVLGTLWTFGLMRLFNVQLNLANTIFLPLIVGAGVEYGIVITRRWYQDGGGTSNIIFPSNTAKGVLLAGLTTTVGFGSLIVSEHQGIKSLGILTALGSLSVLAAAIIFLPAFLHLAALYRARRKKPQICEPFKHKEVP